MGQYSTKEILEQNAFKIRMGIIQAINANHGGHIGGSLDLAEAIAVVYTDYMRVDTKKPDWNQRDFFIMSKGHAGPALYSALAFKGFFDYFYLNNLNKPSQKMPGHCDRLKVPGVDATTGSLGQGLSIACGVALSAKVRKTDQRVFCVTGDGESAEGQIWEAAQFAAHFKLNNLVAFLDNNHKQIDGTNEEVLSLGDPVQKYRAFGWRAFKIDGTDVISIQDLIYQALYNAENKPTMIVLDTVKGKGLSFVEEMENNHCIGFNEDLSKRALEELRQQAIKLGLEDYFSEQQIFWKQT